MRQQTNRSRIAGLRLKALAVTAVTIWGVSVTAGSTTASAAGQALWDALPFHILQHTLGRPAAPEDPLTPAAALTIRESPLLLSVRRELTLQHTRGEEAPLPPLPETPPEPVPAPVLPPLPQADNGVPSRTLIPRSDKGYTVVGKSYISSTREAPIDGKALEQPFTTRLSDGGPQLLIVHSHTTEAYTPADPSGVAWSGDHRSTDLRWGVVRIGDIMADTFSQAGIQVLHDRTLYDYPDYNGSYSRSLEGIQRHLEAHPSIRFVLDVHRDAIEDKNGTQYKVISDIEGLGSAAQMTLVVGSDGSGLPHPDWMENLRLAVALQNDLLTAYPTLMRPILLRNSRYNQHAAPGSLLVEVGAAGNSPEEAALAGQLFAQRMAAVIKAP